MANNIQVRKTAYGHQYRVIGDGGWRYFTDDVKTTDQMVDFFMKGRHLKLAGKVCDKPNLISSEDEK